MPYMSTAFDLAPTLPPTEMAQWAHRIVDRLTGLPDDADSWSMLMRILNFAAEAEQQISEQKRRIAELEAMSSTDELTGLANRRGLEDFLKRALAAAARHCEEGVLVFIDLDDFKGVNDTYGHDAGDATLRAVAWRLKEVTRASDLVARIGGDEFVAVLTRCPAVLGPNRCERIQAALTRLPVRHGPRLIPVSATCGHASYGPGVELAELLGRADRAMYGNKAGKMARAARR